MNFISIAKKSAGIQISELRKINKIFNKSFSQAINVISGCKGKVIFTGQGKSGKQASSISSTMSSVGIPSFYIHPSETSHGDSGAIQRKDVLVIISFSGNTPELKNVIQHANRFGIKIIGCSSNKSSMLSKASDIKIILPKVKEADPIGMVPTTSTAITLLYFNCLAIALMKKMNFTKNKFRVLHSGGNIGKSLLDVASVMVTGKKIPIIDRNKTIGEAVKVISAKKLGVVLVTKKGKLSSIVTDGDCRRALGRFSKKDKIEKIATRNPLKINEEITAQKAMQIMAQKKITSLVVASKSGKVKGICHIHNLLSHGIK
jgi:arabinose-5-phosphate isomerase